MNFTKGMPVRFSGFIPQIPGTYSLAGVQDRFASRQVSLTGVVAHIRGNDHPCPTSFGIWIAPDNLVMSDFKDLIIGVGMCQKCNRVEIGPVALHFISPIKID
jgi:hypothetical protein